MANRRRVEHVRPDIEKLKATGEDQGYVTHFTPESIQKLMRVLSDILSEKYGCKITLRAVPKEEYYAKHGYPEGYQKPDEAANAEAPAKAEEPEKPKKLRKPRTPKMPEQEAC